MSILRRDTSQGRTYLDLQKLARSSGRTMQALLPMYVSERWLARLAASDQRDRFVLKGGVLLAALGQRRPTQDADLLALRITNDHDTVIAYVNEIASIAIDDGILFDSATTKAATIREGDLYVGVRLTMNASLASAQVKLKLDINFGDPVTPQPQTIELPTLLEGPAVSILGYPIVTVLAEKLSTAIKLGEANTRVRDYVDIFNLTGARSLNYGESRAALAVTAAHRGIALRPLSDAIGQLTQTRGQNYRAYRTDLGTDGTPLPRTFDAVVTAVISYGDPLMASLPDRTTWDPATRTWR